MSKGRAKAESFMRHLEPLQGALEAYCRRSVRDPNALPDVLQSAVANAYRDFHLYAEGTNFRAWIFRYLHLEVLNWNRRYQRTRHAELPADLSVEESWQLVLDEPLCKALLDDPDPVLDQCDAVLAEAIRDLTFQERAALLLQAVGEFKYREIAEILQVPIGTVMTSLARGRLRLRQRLAHFGAAHGLLKRTTP
ncbi:MAG: sigma-70 family RNA polymerase sigma factor [Gemmataceae bacterium]|nr:sigma-70 family RNA polymerase sigma factor [Gemmataceae bacterium]